MPVAAATLLNEGVAGCWHILSYLCGENSPVRNGPGNGDDIGVNELIVGLIREEEALVVGWFVSWLAGRLIWLPLLRPWKDAVDLWLQPTNAVRGSNASRWAHTAHVPGSVDGPQAANSVHTAGQ